MIKKLNKNNEQKSVKKIQLLQKFALERFGIKFSPNLIHKFGEFNKFS